MLESTLATQFVPGSNRRGDMAGANWVFCLDRLELGRVLSLGTTDTAALGMLSSLANEIMVWEPHAGRRRELHSWLESRNLCNISVADRPQASWQLHDLQVDLVLPQRGHWRVEDVRPLLRPGAGMYLEAPDVPGRERDLPALATAFPAKPMLLRMTPMHGAVRTALPVGDMETARYFARHRMHPTRFRNKLLARAERALARRGLIAPVSTRLGILGGTESNGAARPPLYLRRLAALHGLDIQDHRWGLWARGIYRSQKILFYLFEGTNPAPSFVVKMVRDARFNPRLENEYRALARLLTLPAALRTHAPEAFFIGHPGGLAAVAERVVDGVPFNTRTDGSVTCVHALEAVEFLTELGHATARPVAATHASTALAELLARFETIYSLPTAERDFLRQQIDRLAQSSWPVPEVLQHGDPGPWNVFVRSDGHVVFLDWESAEEHGMPLWDLLYFLRSYVLLGRMQGLQRRLETFAAGFLADSAQSRWIRQMVEIYCGRVGVHPSLVEPLFYTCWMHRAVKESVRLGPEELANGRFLAVLRHCIQQRESPGLRQLFETGEPANV